MDTATLDTRPFPVSSGDAVEGAAAAFERDGLCILDARLPADLVARCRRAAVERLDLCLAQARRRGFGEIPVGTDAGFAEIVHRAPNRFDVLHGTAEAPFTDPLLNAAAPWMPLVYRILGPEAHRIYRGLLVARPGGAEQPWHTDGEHLFPGSDTHLPAHCLNVFVALVDLTAEIGPTELCPGTHRLTGNLRTAFEQDRNLLARIGWSGATVAPELAAGSVLLFDYRLVHRGLPNRTGTGRPLHYQTFAAPWFRDVRNFPDRRLFP